MPMIRVNDVALLYEVADAPGEPVALVHGPWTDHTSWRQVVPGLAIPPC
ncbi:alpha/beta fold hydrolase [Allosalinactinospora lopnorensis]|nr:hypothetical protein [Allosalinactinospora lopnorensis]